MYSKRVGGSLSREGSYRVTCWWELPGTSQGFGGSLRREGSCPAFCAWGEVAVLGGSLLRET